MRFETEMPATYAELDVSGTIDGRFYLAGKNAKDQWQICMTREQAVKTARALLKIAGEEEKAIMDEPINNRPPLGTPPYFIRAGVRICELGEAISKYSTTSQVGKIKEWAEEIVLQCVLIETMRKNKRGENT
jgi:hypothetical protein